jgi:antimicrobial peptide system SdpB family protein
MFKKLENITYKWAQKSNPWTNVYGISRSIIALATALTLLFNDAETFFLPTSDSLTYPKEDLMHISIFNLVPNDYFYLNIIRYICIILLLIVVSGWRPRLTGVIHWYISYSFASSSITIDGGDSVASVFTLLIIPLTLTDSRRWHWSNMQINNELDQAYIIKKIIALVTLITIRIQVAILYFHATIAKLGGEDWINGTAVWYYLQDSMLGLNPVLFKLSESFITSPLVVIPTWGTLILQTSLVAALFSNKSHRKYFLILALCMHEVFAIFLGLISFSLTMIGVLILYLRPLEQPFKFPAFKFSIQKPQIKNVEKVSS